MADSGVGVQATALHPADIVIIVIYFVGTFAVAIYVSIFEYIFNAHFRNAILIRSDRLERKSSVRGNDGCRIYRI